MIDKDSAGAGRRTVPRTIVRGPVGLPPPAPARRAARPVSPAVFDDVDRKIDDVDRKILEILAADARTPNNALAAMVGVAASTCLSRVRALRTSGAIRGFHADIDPAAVGRPLQAMIAVRLQAGARDRMTAFTDRIRRRPEVMELFFLAGADDFVLHVAAADAGALRDFVVDELSAHTEVALTETNLIFEHLRGAGPVRRPD